MIIDFNRYNGGGSGSGSTDLTNYWNSAVTEQHIESAATEVYSSAVSYTDAALAGKADAKIMIDFDHTTQAERAAVYAELKALYDGGSGATINKNYDFYKTVNTWQGLKIDYYGFSGDTMVFGKVVSPENTADQVVYEQVLTIDSLGNVNVVTNSVGGGPDLSAYYTSAQTDAVIAQAVSGLATEQYVQDALSGVNLDAYYTSAQTEDAISAATAGKADAQNVQGGDGITFPIWNSQGVITGNGQKGYTNSITINGVSKSYWGRGNGNPAPFYAPESAGTAGDILVSTGSGAPVWSAMTFITSADVETQILSKNYTTSAETKTYVDSAVTGVQDQIDTMDEVVSQALVDLDGRVDAISAATQNMVISTDVRQIVKLTQSAYDQLATKDPYTFYIIVNSN